MAAEWEAYRGRRVVVTGGGGYLGTNLISALSSTSCDIIRVLHVASDSGTHDGARVRDVVADIRDQATWPSLIDGADVVFHLAAQTSVAVANRDPVADYMANVFPLLTLLQGCRTAKSPPFVVFSGTVTQAGIPTRLPVDEMVNDNPVTIYDLHKLIGERYLAWYAMEGFAQGTTLRLANVFGPGPLPRGADRGVLNQMIRRAIRGEELTIYGSGAQIRDYTFVDDVVTAFLLAGAHPGDTLGEHYVIGTGVGCSVRQAMELVADAAAARTGKRVEVVSVVPPTPQTAIEGRDFVADSSRFRTATGWQPRWTLAEGIERTMEWILAEAVGGDIARPDDRQ